MGLPGLRAKSRRATPAITSTSRRCFWTPACGAGRTQARQSELGPCRSDRARQRAVIDGCGWRSGAPVEQREMPQWYFASPGFRRTCSHRSIGRALAGEGAHHAAQLDRPFRGAPGVVALDPVTTPTGGRAPNLHDAPRYAVRREIHGAAGSSAASAAAARTPSCGLIAECKRHGTAQQLMETAEKKGFDTGMKALHPSTRTGSSQCSSQTLF